MTRKTSPRSSSRKWRPRSGAAFELRQPRRGNLAARDHGADGNPGARAPDPAQAPAGEHQAHPPGDRHAGRPHRELASRRTCCSRSTRWRNASRSRTCCCRTPAALRLTPERQKAPKQKTRGFRGFFAAEKTQAALVAGQLFVLDPQHVLVSTCRVLGDAVDRANLDALRRVVVADALGALVRVDLVDLLALRDGARSGTPVRTRRS
jgi:hypothetical protein